MEKGGGCKDWSLRLHFVENNIISQDRAHLFKTRRVNYKRKQSFPAI